MSGSEARVCVVGAGTMGAQIAQQCALSGFNVALVDTDTHQLDGAVRSNRGHLQRRVEKGKLSAEDMKATLGRVHTTTDLGDAAGDVSFVVEAIVEDLDAKQRIFVEIERVAPFDAVLASNSSTLLISRIADGVARKDRCINLHFFHPALVMRLVEVMRGPQTSDSTVDRTMEFARQIGKDPVLIDREVHGLVVNRILGAIKREALWLAEEGYAAPEEIDRAVKLGLNHPMGPFELTDFSGLDVFHAASEQLYAETGDERYRPSRLLEEKISQGHLGRKSGRGFYDYGEDDRPS